MSGYRFFKIGEEVKYTMGIETIHNLIIKLNKEFYGEEFQKIMNEFGKVITNVHEADEFMIFLSNKGIKANFMEYYNVML